MFSATEQIFQDLPKPVDFCSLRLLHSQDEVLAVRRDVVQPLQRHENTGAMLTVIDRGGMGYAATADLSRRGLLAALQRAHGWAKAGAGNSVFDANSLPRPNRSGDYQTPVHTAWSELPLADKLDLLREQVAKLHTDDRIVNWTGSFWRRASESVLLTSDGVRISQSHDSLLPSLSATAQQPGETQTRTFSGAAQLRQGGLEILQATGFYQAPARIAEQVLELLSAPNCPNGTLDAVIAPDQMILQIHESIGHPLELDRILGDERNYAGRSFVSPDMFGSYRYGSEQLNITFDCEQSAEAAAYGFDDEGTAAEKTFLIKDGILLRPLGGASSQHRANLPGVACTRASDWTRPPIDRMANLNLEPGEQSVDELISQVESGLYMETNRSWSIDDSRNKFQFGCEWARLIENGELTSVVKNPNYRGVSAQFWRSLDAVGRDVELLGTPYCGKGEPNQAIAVGHATPAALFRQIAVFGGE